LITAILGFVDLCRTPPNTVHYTAKNSSLGRPCKASIRSDELLLDRANVLLRKQGHLYDAENAWGLPAGCGCWFAELRMGNDSCTFRLAGHAMNASTANAVFFTSFFSSDVWQRTCGSELCNLLANPAVVGKGCKVLREMRMPRVPTLIEFMQNSAVKPEITSADD